MHFLKGRKQKKLCCFNNCPLVLWLGTFAWLPFSALGLEPSCVILITSALWFGPWLFLLLMWLPTLTICLVPRLTTGSTCFWFPDMFSPLLDYDPDVYSWNFSLIFVLICGVIKKKNRFMLNLISSAGKTSLSGFQTCTSVFIMWKPHIYFFILSIKESLW